MALGGASLSVSILTAIFPGGPGLDGTRMSPFWILLELLEMVTAGAVRHAKQNCSQIINTNKPTPKEGHLMC